RYLIGKANAAPQQLENVVKQRVKGQPSGPGKVDTPSQPSQKDDEIAMLKNQLAEAKLNQTKAAPKRGETKRSTAKSQASVAPSKQIRSLSGDSARSKRAPSTLGLVDKEQRERHERRRGRSDSIKTAVAAQPQLKALSKNHEVQRPHSTDTLRSKAKSKAHDEKIYSANQEIAFKKPVYPKSSLQSLPQSEYPQRPESDDEFCVVEVTEEDPRLQRRVQPSRKNVVEVIERDKYRTKYVIR
ncbi:MAG: hypothetical protein Q9183_007286, partial [Haloplaca sp. 2 TL-2023]